MRAGLVLAHVDDHEPLVHVDLACRQADARGLVHGLEHVVQQALEGRIGNLRGIHRHRLGAQSGIGELEDGKQ